MIETLFAWMVDSLFHWLVERKDYALPALRGATLGGGLPLVACMRLRGMGLGARLLELHLGSGPKCSSAASLAAAWQPWAAIENSSPQWKHTQP